VSETRSGGRLPLLALFAATAVSFVGSSASMVAIPWYVLVTTGSPALTGLVTFFQVLSEVVAGLFGGAIVDRIGTRTASIATDLGSGVAVAMIPLLHATVGISFWQIVVLVAIRALFDSPGITARVSMVPELARAAGMDLERANSFWHTLYRGASLIGAPLAGGLILLVGTANVLWLDAASFAGSAALVAIGVPAALAGRQAPSGDSSYLGEVLAGLGSLVRSPLMLTVAVTVGITNLLDAPLNTVLIPVYARQGHGGSAGVGVLLGAMAAGGMIGNLLWGVLGRRLPRRLSFVLAFAVIGLVFFGIAASPNVAVAAVCLFLAGVGGGPINPIVVTTIHENVAPALHGRVLAATRSVAFAMFPVGALIGGIAVQALGLTPVLLILGALYLATTASMWLNPVLRGLSPTTSEVAVSGH
jgi:MFS family permease